MNTTTKNLLLSFIVPLMILLTRPLGLSMDQSVVLAALLLTLTLWVNKTVERTYSSLFLIMVFLLFGNTSFERVFTFPLSDNFLLIVLSFLFSEGIVKSRLIDKLLKPYIGYFATSLPRLFFSVWLISLIMIFIIPQPFIRLILLGTIFREYLMGEEIEDDAREPILLGVFLIAIVTNTFFLKGDIIMNPALISMSGIQISPDQWTLFFLPPGLVHLFFLLSVFSYVYKKNLKGYSKKSEKVPSVQLQKNDLKRLILVLVPLIFWALEDLHPIPGTYVILFGIILMYLGRILSLKDLGSIQWSLLIFLTATFSIGPVMSGSGTAQILFGHLKPIFPQEYSLFMLLAVILASMVIHMVLGSIVTTMSVVLPGMALLTEGIMSPILMSLIVFVTLALHFILPFHSVHLVVGEGYGFFTQERVIRTGIALTVVILISLFAIYIPWWHFVGLS